MNCFFLLPLLFVPLQKDRACKTDAVCRRCHDYFNIVALGGISAFWIWSEIMPKYNALFFYLLLGYVIFDYLLILCYPSCVGMETTIRIHHLITTTLVLCYFKEYYDSDGSSQFLRVGKLISAVEIHTFFKISERVFKQKFAITRVIAVLTRLLAQPATALLLLKMSYDCRTDLSRCIFYVMSCACVSVLFYGNLYFFDKIFY
jgi:hypothetical protein